MRNTSMRFFAIGAALVVGAVAACHPGEVTDIEDTDLVLTLFDTTADFGSFATYAMPDTIVRVDSVGGSDDADPDVDSQVLAAIAEKFDDLGYTRVFPPFTTEPDVVVLVEAAARDYTSFVPIYPWWGYWGWWPGWDWWCCYGPGWGPYYPWIPVPVQQTQGTLSIQMVTPEETPDEDEAIPLVWVAVLNGLMEGSEESILMRASDMLDQAFDQSPYLR